MTDKTISDALSDLWSVTDELYSRITMLTGNRSGEIEKGLAASRTAIARLREGQGVAVIPWDHPENRENPRVEKEAQEFYSHFPYNGPGQKPAWVPNGNSEMQDVARKYARIDLRAADFKG